MTYLNRELAQIDDIVKHKVNTRSQSPTYDDTIPYKPKPVPAFMMARLEK